MYSKENKAELPGIFFFFGEVEPVGPENASFPVTELSPQLHFKCQLHFSLQYNFSKYSSYFFP